MPLLQTSYRTILFNVMCGSSQCVGITTLEGQMSYRILAGGTLAVTGASMVGVFSGTSCYILNPGQHLPVNCASSPFISTPGTTGVVAYVAIERSQGFENT